MVPESPSVCFRCKMCKVCFLTMKEIERHVKSANHYIRPSSNTNSPSKEHSSATESSDDKPLNLSSKSTFPPVQPPTPHDEIDLTLSSEDSETEDGKRAKRMNALKDSIMMKEGKSIDGPQSVTSRKASVKDPHLESTVYLKVGGENQEDIADIETDTVSSTSSEPPPPPDKVATTHPPPPDTTNEAEISTQFVQGDEQKSHETCSTTQNIINESTTTKDSMEVQVGGGKEQKSFSTADCDDDDLVDVEMVDSPISDEKAEVSSTATQTAASQSFVQVENVEEKVDKNEQRMEEEKTNQNDDCEMSANENDEPEPQTVERTIAHSPDVKKNNRTKRYRCKHCEERFSFPVQVHMHMQKVHSLSSSRKESKPARRSSVNNPTTNNNNNDPSKSNAQMYPLRSHHARAKRRTRSMQSNDGGVSRRNSQNNNNNEEKRERKVVPRKITYFTCRHCNKKFPLLNQLKIHLHKVHPEMTKKFQNSNPNKKSTGKKKSFSTQSQSQRLLLTSKRRQTTTSVMLQTPNRSLKVSTRSASRADSEPGTGRMSTRRRSSIAAKSDKNCGGDSIPTTVSSRRSSRRKEEDSQIDKIETVESETEESEESTHNKTKRGKMRYTNNNNNNNNNNTINKHADNDNEAKSQKIISAEESDAEEKVEVKAVKKEDQTMKVDRDDGEEEDTIYNDSDCMIIDTVESILYALTSKRSQTCPNCNKYCKFAGNFRLHLKACMGLNDDLERTEEGETSGSSGQQEAVPMDEDVEEEEDEEEEEEEVVATDVETEEEEDENENEEETIENSSSENQEHTEEEDAEANIPYYDRIDYRTCWECGFIVSRFHNLSRHLKQKHNISMGTKEVHAEMAKVLHLKK